VESTPRRWISSSKTVESSPPEPLADGGGPKTGAGGGPKTGADGGVAELIENGLVWLDGLRDRRGLSSALTVLLGLGLTVGWAAAQWRVSEPVDDLIPPIQQWSQGSPPFDTVSAAEVSVLVDGAGPTDGDPMDSSTAGPHGETAELVVHVSGAVVEQGLVLLDPGSRLADAIAAAGGATDLADIHRLNLATPLADGMHIRVPEIGERDGSQPLPLIEQSANVDGTGTGSAGTGAGGDARVNVNTAAAVELERLPGIGPALAAAIVSWREENGPFGSVENLLDVPGIGPAKLATLQDQVEL